MAVNPPVRGWGERSRDLERVASSIIVAAASTAGGDWEPCALEGSSHLLSEGHGDAIELHVACGDGIASIAVYGIGPCKLPVT